MRLFKYAVSGLIAACSSCVFAEDAFLDFWWEAQTDIKLYEDADDAAKVVDTLPKGTVLHASQDSSKLKNGWFSVYEMAHNAAEAASGGQLYIHFLYKLPEGTAYVKNENLRPTLKAIPGRTE